jgi:hypothetical protein
VAVEAKTGEQTLGGEATKWALGGDELMLGGGCGRDEASDELALGDGTNWRSGTG